VKLTEAFPLAITPHHPLRNAIKQTLEHMDTLHQIPSMPSLGIRCEPMDESGFFDPENWPYGLRIADRCETPHLTTAHEVGHAIDWFIFGRGQWYGSETVTDPVWQHWHRVVSSSRHVQQLHQDKGKTEWGRPLIAICTYLLKPRELLARAYAQRTALRCSLMPLKAELEAGSGKKMAATEWDEEDFIAVDEALSNLLVHHGCM
jgi:hypothetical protein